MRSPTPRNHLVTRCELVTLLAYYTVLLPAVSFSEDTDSLVLEKREIHLRSTDQQEWSRFPAKPPGSSHRWKFKSNSNQVESTLTVRQVDVRQTWNVTLNSKRLGNLKKDQNDLTAVFPIPPRWILDGENELVISTNESRIADDITVGPLEIHSYPRKAYLKSSTLVVRVVDEAEMPVPCRITIVTPGKTLVPLGLSSNEKLAVRAGVVYTLTGQATIPLPQGDYQVFANRGFEYSRDSQFITTQPGQAQTINLKINRVVDTRGWISCDTHVHTVTHSGHGDCTIEERMITLAGENLEFPIATDHNKQIDYRSIARKLKANGFFTPQVGNEVTTAFGHFNAFPFAPGSDLPDPSQNDWQKLIPDILSKPNVKVAILNHARDIHAGYRPFAPENFNEATGQSLNGRPFLFNAMEVINSAAQQTDPFELFRDWLALTNRGHQVLPIGSSDSHDVNAFIVGQGRTYILCDDRDPGNLDSGQAIQNLLSGKLSVSCGLLAKLKVNRDCSAGDLVQHSDSYEVQCEMVGPHWLPGNKLELYRNGTKIRQQTVTIQPRTAGAHRTQVTWKLKNNGFDSFLTLLVSGPGIRHPSWPLAQPYQPTSPNWNPCVLGFTGAVYLDENGDGKFNSPYQTAQAVWKQSGGDLKTLCSVLANFDVATAIQAASLFQDDHRNLLSESNSKIWRAAEEPVRQGFTRFLTAWRLSEAAKIKKE
jgi:hypothetical protein